METPIYDFVRRIDSEDQEGRFYEGVLKDPETEVETRVWAYPSVTTKLGEVYPTGYYLAKWIRDHGDYGRLEFERAADKGTEVHIAINKLLQGELVATVNMPYKVKKCIQAFIDWFIEFKPKVMATEMIVVNHEEKYAGTLDFVCRLDYEKGKTKYQGIYVIDFKTSSGVYESHKIQDSAYAKALPAQWQDKTAILHLGNTTKAGYSFVDFDLNEYWEQFKHFNKTFEILHPDAKPKEHTFPDVFSIPELITNQPQDGKSDDNQSSIL